MDFFAYSTIQLKVLGYVVLAMFLGALIGIERETARRPAGLRTHTLVAGAAALFVLMGDVLVSQFDLALRNDILRSDPIRIIEAVITGVSFLGAGTIIRGGADSKVLGLTTAASILLSAAVGIAVALSQMVLAVGVTLLVLVTLRGFRLAEQWLGLKFE